MYSSFKDDILPKLPKFWQDCYNAGWLSSSGEVTSKGMQKLCMFLLDNASKDLQSHVAQLAKTNKQG